MRAASLLLLLVLAGCGGHSGSSGGTVAPPPNTSADALVGTWSGTYRASNDDDSGTITVTIARDPSATGLLSGVRVTGTAQDSKYGAATVTGFMDDRNVADGAPAGSNLALQFPNSTAESYLGRLTVDGTGHLVGTLGLYLFDASLPTYFNLAPVATP